MSLIEFECDELRDFLGFLILIGVEGFRKVGMGILLLLPLLSLLLSMLLLLLFLSLILLSELMPGWSSHSGSSSLSKDSFEFEVFLPSLNNENTLLLLTEVDDELEELVL